MKRFNNIQSSVSLNDLVNVLSLATEFSDLHLRVSEKKLLNVINKDVRFPLKGRVKTNSEKIFILIQV